MRPGELIVAALATLGFLSLLGLFAMWCLWMWEDAHRQEDTSADGSDLGPFFEFDSSRGWRR